ncbi:uncharacterized protein [Patagioenas fasciata]|uniref:uncharacterized protein n=1 Tax=Patagioenas fasciata TaxID=372321 RepID=UPI003A9A21F9
MVVKVHHGDAHTAQSQPLKNIKANTGLAAPQRKMKVAVLSVALLFTILLCTPEDAQELCCTKEGFPGGLRDSRRWDMAPTVCVRRPGVPLFLALFLEHLPFGASDLPWPKHLGLSCAQPWGTEGLRLKARDPAPAGTPEEPVGMRLFRPRWPRAAAEPCGTRYGRWWKWPWQLLYCYSCWVCRDPSYGLEEAASCQQPCPLVPRPPVCCQHTLLCLSAQRGDLYLGHVVALVAQTKEEGEQRTVHVALHPLLVVRHHGLHPLSEEADGELSQLAGLLGGRKKGGLQSQQLSAHGPRGQMSWRDSVPGKLPRQPSGPSTAGRAFGAVSHCLTPSQGQATASPNAPAPAANIAPLDATLLTMSALSDPLMTPPGNVESMTRSLSRKFFKIFFRGWGVEIIMSHMSRAVLQESALSAGQPGPQQRVRAQR